MRSKTDSSSSLNPRKRGILIVNLGTPHSHHPKDVYRYLIEFLTDPRVIDTHWIKRHALVRGLIVPSRYRQSAEQYRHVWTDKGSPLMHHGRVLQVKLQEVLGEGDHVVLAIHYQTPSIAQGLEKLRHEKVDEIIILPLFPHYCSATTGSIFEEVMRCMKNWQTYPQLRFINQYFDHPGLISAFCARANQYPIASYDHLIMSFHGLPERQLRKSSCNSHCLSKGCCAQICQNNRLCYKAQCHATARAIAAQLGLNEESYSICFQSRLGKEPWIRPYTSDVMRSRAEKGDRRLLVMSPSFICDCLETIFEISHEYGDEFKKLGGEDLQLVEGLNDHPLWVETLRQILDNKSESYANI